MEDEQTVLLSRAVASAVNAYNDRFKRPAARESSSEEDSEEDGEVGEDDGANDSV